MEPRVIPILGFSEPVSCWTHLLGAGAVLVAMGPLLRRGREAGHLGSAVVYVLGALFVLAVSGVYHLLEPHRAPRAVFQRLDHVAIWLQIAGTVTPIHVVHFRGLWRWGFLTLIWTLAVTGLTLKTVFFESMPASLGMGLYIMMGWLGAMSAWHLSRANGWRFARPLIVGGVWYTAGALIEAMEWPTLIDGVVEAHELFHVMILGGVFVHWRFISRQIYGHPFTPR